MSTSTEYLEQFRADRKAGGRVSAPPRQPTRQASAASRTVVDVPPVPATGPLWPALVRGAAPGEEDQFAAALLLATTIDLAPADPPGLPAMEDLRLPGPRRAREGRGGATAPDVTMRMLIRSPYMKVLAVLFPDATNTGGRPATPVPYWIFLAGMAREFGSVEQAHQTVISFYDSVVRPEFAAIGVHLDRASRYKPVPGPSQYGAWRKAHVLKVQRQNTTIQRLDAMNHVFTVLSLRMHVAIASARGAEVGDFLDPAGWQALISDSSIFKPPSDVYVTCHHCDANFDPTACPHSEDDKTTVGSRRKTGAARVHRQGHDYDNKAHGVTKGFHHVSVMAKNDGSYGRMVLGVDVARDAIAEMDLSMPLLANILELAGTDWIRYISYDGLLMGKHHLELLRLHGVPVVNTNTVKTKQAKKTKTATKGKQKTKTGSVKNAAPPPAPVRPDAPTQGTVAGWRTRGTGKHKDTEVETYTHHLGTYTHLRDDGTVCAHHLINDDGGVYETDRPGKKGYVAVGATRLRFLRPTAFDREQLEDGTWRVTLTLTVPCVHGDLRPTFVLTDTPRGKDGSVARSTRVHLRHMPEAWLERYRKVNGIRNNVESLFSWLEKRFYHKDRAASWGRDAQLFDDLAAGILCNSETWAHALPDLRTAAQPGRRRRRR